MLGKALCLVGTCLLDKLGRHSAPYLVLTNLCALQHQCAGSYYCALAHFGIVEHRCAHAYQRSAAYRAGMHGGVVAYAHVVFNDNRTGGVGNMHAGTVLHVYTVAYGYGSHVSAHHGGKP